jgi:hypothetical protein
MIELDQEQIDLMREIIVRFDEGDKEYAKMCKEIELLKHLAAKHGYHVHKGSPETHSHLTIRPWIDRGGG